MKNNYTECLLLIRELSGKELVELSYKVAQTIYVKSLMEHIETQKMQPLIEEIEVLNDAYRKYNDTL